MGIVDMGLRAPHQERLEMLAKDFGAEAYSDLDFDGQVKIYNIALMEMQVTALGVLAQFVAGAAE